MHLPFFPPGHLLLYPDSQILKPVILLFFQPVSSRYIFSLKKLCVSGFLPESTPISIVSRETFSLKTLINGAVSLRKSEAVPFLKKTYQKHPKP